MDYGFMKAMMAQHRRSGRGCSGTAEADINYYYGGQFYAVFLTKITFTDVKQTYHLMRTMVASFAFVLPFSITYHLQSRVRATASGKRAAIKARLHRCLAVFFREAPFPLQEICTM